MVHLSDLDLGLAGTDERVRALVLSEVTVVDNAVDDAWEDANTKSACPGLRGAEAESVQVHAKGIDVAHTPNTDGHDAPAGLNESPSPTSTLSELGESPSSRSSDC